MLLYAVILALFCVYFFLSKPPKRNGLSKIPEPPGHPLLGHASTLKSTTSVINNLSQYIENYGKTVKITIGPSVFPLMTSLVTIDYKFVKFVLSQNKILKKSQNYQFLRRWLGNGLLISDGDYWRRHRKILTLAFHTEILKDFVGVSESMGDVLIGKLGKYDGKSSVDVHRLVTLCTLDIICETAMGTKMNIQSGENSQYVESVQQMGRIVIERALSLIKVSKYTFWLSRDYYIQNNALKILHGFTLSVIDSKRNKPVEKTTKRMAFLDLLLKVSHDENILTIGELQEEVDTFMFEGHDTTAAGISFILYCLADHPEEQEKVLQEQKELFGDDKNPPVTYSDLQDMKYLECVIKETFRLYPPVPIIGRYTTEEIKFDDTLIPKNTNIVFFIYGLHRSSEFFPEPEKFKPGRFQNFKSAFPYAYIPFSAGSRNCIGQRFAMLETKSIISKIVRHFEIKPTLPRHELNLSVETVLKSVNGIKVTLKKRK
ncbi:hypothetical protein Zmor_015997 [Zophobas morio]|uniref:Cytochrome P450 n=1 Tax=Zophobas morio TaxID=2755281 RepID=A0AA38IL41_9CUCU|nr:hypothetical protein Zmor_015997 [Zophobas morio]